MNLKLHESGIENDETIIFLHGLGVSSWMWHDQVEFLRESYHCISIDLAGSGESYQVSWQSLAESAWEVKEIIETKVVSGQAHIVGLSLGGYVALELLANHPNVIASMIVSGITIEPIMRRVFVEPIARLTARLMKVKLFARQSARLLQLPEEVLPLYFKDLERISAEMVRQVYREVLQYELPELSAEQTQKLLVVAGDKEAKPVLTSLATMAQCHPTATTATAPNAHHGWNAELPRLFSQMVEGWVTGQLLPTELSILQRSTGLAIRQPLNLH